MRHKQYFVLYDSDKKVCGSYEHEAGNASTIKSAKGVIRRVREIDKDNNPRNFRIYDCLADVDKATNFVPCVYREN